MGSEHLQTVQTEYGILDLMFSPTKPCVFAVASSIGSIELFEIRNPGSVSIEKKRDFSICDSSTLVLHVDWFSEFDVNEKIAMSLSDGRIGILSFNAQAHSVLFIQAHTLEAWFVAWNSFENGQIYSGGDDSCFCVSRVPSESSQVDDQEQRKALNNETSEPLHINAKIHGAGVTSIIPLGQSASGEDFVMTGSYDEHLRVLRQQKGRVNWHELLQLPLAGGVWRLKILRRPEHDKSKVAAGWKAIVLASCMHAGPKIIGITVSEQNEWSAKILAEFAEHGSMNYASDARRDFAADGSTKWEVVSSSFYDRKLCLWEFSSSDC